MLSFISGMFYYFLPIWIVCAAFLLFLIPVYLHRRYPENEYLKNKVSGAIDLLINEKRGTHYVRVFVIITLCSYWFISEKTMSETFWAMFIDGIKFTAGYIIVNILADSMIENPPWK